MNRQGSIRSLIVNSNPMLSSKRTDSSIPQQILIQQNIPNQKYQQLQKPNIAGLIQQHERQQSKHLQQVQHQPIFQQQSIQVPQQQVVNISRIPVQSSGNLLQ